MSGNSLHAGRAPITVYRAQPVRRSEKFLWIAGCLASLFFFASSGLVYMYAYTHYGPAAADAWSYPWSLVAWLFGLLAVLWLIVRLFAARRKVTVLQDGLRIEFPLRRSRSLAWQQIVGVSTQITETVLAGRIISRHQHAWLFTWVGQKIFLSDQIVGLPELLTRVKAAVYPRLLPDLRVALRDDKALAFGPLLLRREEGIRLRSGRQPRLILWEQMRRFTVHNGYLVIEFSGGILRFPVGEIPNLELLLQLIREEIQ
ncbi:MAG: DUF6585 family protein [Chloroflexota bacterium]